MSKESRLLGQIDKKLSHVLDMLTESRPRSNNMGSLTTRELLNMPDHIRKTALALDKTGRATAEIVSRKTHRVRAQESVYLNDLVLMEIAQKEREGRKVYFYIPKRRKL